MNGASIYTVSKVNKPTIIPLKRAPTIYRDEIVQMEKNASTHGEWLPV
jgi:hypothetical protein